METKRSQKAEQRGNAILQQALVIFAREGFHRADVQLIADMAEVGKGTVYRHFGNKEALFLATGKYCIEKLGEYALKHLGSESETKEPLAHHDPVELLKRIAVVVAEFYQKNPQAIEIMIQERAEFRETVYPTHLLHRAETRSGVDELIAGAMQSGQFRTLDARAVTDAYADLLFGSVVNGCLEGSRTKLVERVSQAMDVFINGLVAHPATNGNSNSHSHSEENQ